MAHVYHWKHGWIPLDHTALKHGGHPSQAKGPIKGASKVERSAHHPAPETGIRDHRDLAKAATTVHQVPKADRSGAAAEVRAASTRLTGSPAQKRVDAAQAKLDAVNARVAASKAAPKALQDRALQAAVIHGRGSEQHKAALAARDAAGHEAIAAETHHLTAPIKPGQLSDFAGGSAAAHLEPDGHGGQRFTAERAELHRKIIDGMLAGNTPVANPAFNVMGGGPASGKSTMERRTPQLRDNAALINPDDVKDQLPEYAAKTQAKDPSAAAFAHEESSYIAKQAQAEAFRRRINVTLDGTGDSDEGKLRGKIKDARDHGYAVNGFYVTVDTDEAVRRANLRGAKSGRFVPEETVRTTHENISRVLPHVIDSFDKVQVFDNNGSEIKLIAEKAPGSKHKVTDQARWQQFLDKAPGSKPADRLAAAEQQAAAARAKLGPSKLPARAPGTGAQDARLAAHERATNGIDFASMTPAQKIDAAAQMFGTGSKQHQAAQAKFGGATKTAAKKAAPRKGSGPTSIGQRVANATTPQLEALILNPKTDPKFRSLLKAEVSRRKR